MHDGETRILTLADASILDDDGEIRADDNVLEDAAKAREADLKRKKECVTCQAHTSSMELQHPHCWLRTGLLYSPSSHGGSLSLSWAPVHPHVHLRLRAGAAGMQGGQEAVAALRGGQQEARHAEQV